MGELPVCNAQGDVLVYLTEDSATHAFNAKFKRFSAVKGHKIIHNKFSSAYTKSGKKVKKGDGYNLILLV